MYAIDLEEYYEITESLNVCIMKLESWIDEVVKLLKSKFLSAKVKFVIPTEACVPLIYFVIKLFSAVTAT